jgi:hypothetical protein
MTRMLYILETVLSSKLVIMTLTLDISSFVNGDETPDLHLFVSGWKHGPAFAVQGKA